MAFGSTARFAPFQAGAWQRLLEAALTALASRRLGVSPDSFHRLAEPGEDGWRILLYDNLEGGSGNSR